MIDRYKRHGCCALVLIIQIILFSSATLAIAETRSGNEEAKSTPTKGFDLTAPLEKKLSSPIIGNIQDSPPSRNTDSFEKVSAGFAVQKKLTLAELVGMSEISVLADNNGQFVKSLDQNQTIVKDLTHQVDETSLREAIFAGRNFNRSSLAAQALKEQAEAKTGQVLGLLLPEVSVRVNVGREKSSPSVAIDELTGEIELSSLHTRSDLSVVVRQPVFNLPSYLDWRRHQAIEQAREEDYRASDGDAYLATASAYLSLVSSRLQADVTRDFEIQLAELLKYISKRSSAGASSISDMARVRARSEQTQSFRLEQESAHTAAWLEFVRLTNIVPRMVHLPGLEDFGVSLLPASFEQAVVTAMRFNPEIAAIVSESRAAEIDHSATKAQYLPRIDAEYSYTDSRHAGGDPSPAGQRDERFMLVLNWSPISGGRDYYAHRERKAREKELQYRLDDQRRRVIQALSANYVAISSLKERIAGGYQELNSISIAAEAMSKRMLSGNQSLLDLLDVYDRLFQARSRLINLHIQEMNTVAQLVRLTFGTPWSSSETEPPTSSSNQPSSFPET